MSAADETAPPSGAVSFLFTDVEGSTRRWEQLPDQMRVALEAHDAILRAAIEERDGFVFSTAGDAFAAAFQSPEDAVEAASAAQRALAAAEWPGGDELRVRMGVHTGEAQQRDDDYFGPTLNRAARLMSAAHGGQTVVSSATKALVGEVALQDLGEHRLKDLSEPERVWQLLIDGLDADFPPLRTLNVMSTNLPVSLASFLGREADIETLMGALDAHRLVTMTGVGGVGKTRLSLQVAADTSHNYPQGIWFVELAPVRIGDAVPYRFLETLGVDSAAGQTPLQTVAATVGDGEVLMVVDNCEHLPAEAAAAVSELLSACPNLRVLATSRRTLGVAGEQVQPIAPLEVSGSGSPSTRLFLDRASAVQGTVDLSDQLDVIEDICTRLDGVPLAIELAAARTRSMSPGDIVTRLDERFRLLTDSRSSDGDERHKALFSTIEWSHDLLDANQKLLFDRLSVFAGAFTLEAAEQICAAGDFDEFDVVDLIDDLVDQSLVIADTSGATTRFRLLETIREFAGRQLGDQARALRARHAEYYTGWAERIGERLWTDDEVAALVELDAGWSDLRAAAVYATGDLALMARLLGSLTMEANVRYRVEIGDWAAVALTVANREGSTADVRAVILGALTTIEAQSGDVVEAAAHGAQLADLCEAGDVAVTFDLWPPVIASVIATGDIVLADRLQVQAELRLAEASQPWAPSVTSMTRAFVSTYSGQLEIARDAIAVAWEQAPDDLSPTLRAFTGWVAASISDAPRSEVLVEVEVALELARAGKSVGAQTLLEQLHASILAEVGDLIQPMRDAAHNLERLLATRGIGSAPHIVRGAAMILVRAERHEVAATLLGWVGGQPNFRSPSPVEIEEALGPRAEEARSAGAALSTEAAIHLAIDTLRAAADDLDS